MMGGGESLHTCCRCVLVRWHGRHPHRMHKASVALITPALPFYFVMAIIKVLGFSCCKVRAEINYKEKEDEEQMETVFTQSK